MREMLRSSPAGLEDARDAGPVSANETATVTFRLRAGASAAQRTALERYLEAAGFATRSSGSGSLALTATLADICRTFRIEMRRFKHPGGEFRSHLTPLVIPEGLHDALEAVLGLDDRPQLRRKLARAPRPFVEPSPSTSGYSPAQIASFYDFPGSLDGSGQCIGLIALGGGVARDDLAAYFAAAGISMPKIDVALVGGAANQPGAAPDCDIEIAVDLEVAGSIAPGARFVVYLAPDTDQGFLEALDAAVHDRVNRPSIISISFGQPEYTWSAQLIEAFDTLLRAAAGAATTVCCASGDAGSSAGAGDGRAHVEFPASSPWVLACGGTQLRIANGAIASEVVWNELAAAKGASGGGISDLYDVPQWQANSNVPPSVNPGARKGRGVPDVGANADKSSGYQVRAGGRDLIIGGTSVAAPLWAGLCARINQKRGRALGFINPALYQNAARAQLFRAITQGDNGAYHAAPDWNPCTGLGSPRGQALLALLSGVDSAHT